MNPDDFKSKLLAALGLGPAPTPAPKPTGRLLAAALGLNMTPAPHQPAQPPSAGAGPYDTLSQLTNSSFADTLHTLTGRPSVYTTATRGNAGEYIGQAPHDTVSISGLEPAPGVVPKYVAASPHRNDDWTLAHELGHKYTASNIARSPDNDTPFLNATRPGWDSVPNAYANTNTQEYRAQAFANAVDFLRQTSVLPPDATGEKRAASILAQHDAEIPGTSGVVSELLSKPIYAKHPLNMARFGVRPDATAVKR